MKKIIQKINRIDCFLIERDENNLLILGSKRKKAFNPVFTIGTICFIASMFFKANNDAPVAAIPLGISTLIMISGVWILSGVGKIVFDKTEGNIYCIYKHLGYLQKIYVHSMHAIDAVETQNGKLILKKDNGARVLICSKQSADTYNLDILRGRIEFLLKKQ